MMKFLLSAGLLGLAAADNCGEYSSDGFPHGVQLKADGLCGASWCKDLKDGAVEVPWMRTFSKAEEECANAGMRLPTITELQSGAAVGTGCLADAAFVWSSTSTGCQAGQYKAYVSSTGAINCVAEALIRCVAENTAAPTSAPTFASMSDALTSSETFVGTSFVAGLGSDGSTIYMCSSELCTKNVLGARNAFQLLSDESEHNNSTPFDTTENSTDGTWTVTPAGLDFVGDDGVSYSFPASCSCSGA